MIKELEALHLTPAERNTPVLGRMLPGIPRPFGRRPKISLKNLACLTYYNLKMLSLSKLKVTIKKKWSSGCQEPHWSPSLVALSSMGPMWPSSFSNLLAPAFPLPTLPCSAVEQVSLRPL